MTDHALQALSILRDPGQFKWYVITLLAFVFYVYTVEAEKRNWSLILAGLACLIHAAAPFLFERTGSDAIRTLHGRMARRGRMDPPTAAELTYQI